MKVHTVSFQFRDDGEEGYYSTKELTRIVHALRQPGLQVRFFKIKTIIGRNLKKVAKGQRPRAVPSKDKRAPVDAREALFG